VKIDYFKIVQDSANFTWKYKILWIFGFLLAFTSGGGGNSSSEYSDVQEDPQISEKLGNFTDKFQSFLESPYFLTVFFGGIFLILILTLLFWYINKMSKAALIKSVDFDKEGKESDINLKNLLKVTRSYMMRLFSLDLYSFLLYFPAVILIIISFFSVGFLKWFSVIVIFPSIILILTSFIAISALKNIAERLIVLDDLQAKQGLKMAWNVARKYFKEYILAWLASLVPGCAFYIVNMTITFVTMIPIVLLFFASITSNDFTNVGMILSGCGCCAISLLLTAVEAPFQVFKVSYWTKFLIELKDISFGKKFAEEEEVVK